MNPRTCRWHGSYYRVLHRPAGEEIWYVLGENFSPYCQVTIEGRRLDAEYITPRLIRLTEDPETDNPAICKFKWWITQ